MNGKTNGINVNSAFKLHGFTLKADAVRLLDEVLKPFDGAKQKKWLETIVNNLQNQSLSSAILDVDLVETAIRDCGQSKNDDEDFFSVIDAFSVPRFSFDLERKKWRKEEPSTNKYAAPHLHPRAASHPALFHRRYNLVYQRTIRHSMFAPSSISLGSSNGLINGQQKIKLERVEDILGSGGVKKETVVLGMLSQLKGNKFFLEDPTGHLQLDLTDASFHTGLFTESCIVLVEGEWRGGKGGGGGVLKVSAIGFPPIEAPSISRKEFGNTLNYFGGKSEKSAKSSLALSQLEKAKGDATLVFLSDLWVDDSSVLAKVRELFQGFRDSPPVAFVFLGSFSSLSHGFKQCSVLREGFQALSEIMREFPELVENSQFVFVPSLTDPILGNILPRPALPNFVISPIVDRIPNCHFMSNPCRLTYCTQEIVLFREDILEKICRNSIRMPSESKEVPEHFVKTLQSQGHLAPLPLHVSPVYWDYDHALSLYPLPDLVVCADKYDTFHLEMNQSIFANPGSFARNNFNFQVYIPLTKTVEDSQIS